MPPKKSRTNVKRKQTAEERRKSIRDCVARYREKERKVKFFAYHLQNPREIKKGMKKDTCCIFKLNDSSIQFDLADMIATTLNTMTNQDQETTGDACNEHICSIMNTITGSQKTAPLKETCSHIIQLDGTKSNVAVSVQDADLLRIKWTALMCQNPVILQAIELPTECRDVMRGQQQQNQKIEKCLDIVGRFGFRKRSAMISGTDLFVYNTETVVFATNILPRANKLWSMNFSEDATVRPGTITKTYSRQYPQWIQDFMLASGP